MRNGVLSISFFRKKAMKWSEAAWRRARTFSGMNPNIGTFLCPIPHSAKRMMYWNEHFLSKSPSLCSCPRTVFKARRDSEFLGFKITATTKGKDNKGKPKYVVKSILTDKAIRKIKKKASQTVKLIEKPINDKEEFKHITFYNSYVIGIHNYYRYATHVRKVFDKIAFQISRKFYARTKRKLKRHGKPLCGYIKEQCTANRQNQ